MMAGNHWRIVEPIQELVALFSPPFFLAHTRWDSAVVSADKARNLIFVTVIVDKFTGSSTVCCAVIVVQHNYFVVPTQKIQRSHAVNTAAAC
jgi:hypothetical protein